MELTDLASVVPVDFAWSDIGSWQEIWPRSPKDAASNVAVGDVILQATAGSLVYAGRDVLTVVTGLAAVVVVHTANLVLVSHRSGRTATDPLQHLSAANGRPDNTPP